MTSQIDLTSLPAQKEYRLTIEHRPLSLHCDTLVCELPPQHIVDSDKPVIENYYCYRLGNELVKVTKIRIGGEAVTLTDRITFHQDVNNELPPNQEPAVAPPQAPENPKEKPLKK